MNITHICKGVLRAGELSPLAGEVSLDIMCLYALLNTKKISNLKYLYIYILYIYIIFIYFITIIVSVQNCYFVLLQQHKITYNRNIIIINERIISALMHKRSN